MQIRIGHGIDIHKFKQGRKLFLGGVEVPHTAGLDGHSDADVLIHSIIDALFGAAGMGDIGTHFPDTDKTWKNADSKEMLKITHSKIKTAGYKIINLDATVLTEQPKLKPYIELIRNSLSEILEVDPICCSVKAGTAEKLGFIGRNEGMMAQAIVLISKD